MEYIIFGCGDIGRTALECLGADNVSCFADNYHSGETVCGKRVVSFTEMVEICGAGEDTAVVVASDIYWEEMTAQAREAGIARYAVFREYTWPSYRKDRRRFCVSAGALAEKFGLPGCSRIGIYGETLLTARLAEEIRRVFYGELPVQIGYCNGHNVLLNAVEYHRCSEVNVAATDAVLIVGRQQDVTENCTYDTAKMEAFLVEAGTAVELYATTLHYAPCSADEG